MTAYDGESTVRITFEAGVVDALYDSQIPANALSAADNCEPDIFNATGVRTRRAIAAVSTGTYDERGIGGPFNGSQGDYVATSTKIWNWTTPTDLDTGLTSSVNAFFATMNNIDFMTNGTDHRKTSDGSTWSDAVGGSPPAAFSCIAVHGRRMLGISGSLLYWSDFEDGDTWPATNALNFTPDTLVSVVSAGNFAFLLGENGFYHVNFGVSAFPSVPYRWIHGGGIAPRSLIETERGVFFFGKDALVWCPDRRTPLTVMRMTVPVITEDILDNPTVLAALNRAFCVWDCGRNWLHLWTPSTTTAAVDAEYVIVPGDPQSRLPVAVYPQSDDRAKMGCAAYVETSTGNLVYCLSDLTTKKLMQITTSSGSGDDDSAGGFTVVESTFTTGRIQLGNVPWEESDLEFFIALRGQVTGQQPDFDYQYTLDDSTTASTVVTVTRGVESLGIYFPRHYLFIPGERARFAKLTIARNDSGTGRPLIIEFIELARRNLGEVGVSP